MRALLQPRALDALTRLPNRPSVQGGGRWMIIDGSPIKPQMEQILEMLEEVQRVFYAFGKR